MGEVRALPVAPRVLTAPQAARYIGRSPSWFYEHRAQLATEGFPARLPMVDAYDRAAIDDWLDRLGGRQLPGQTTGPMGWKRKRR